MSETERNARPARVSDDYLRGLIENADAMNRDIPERKHEVANDLASMAAELEQWRAIGRALVTAHMISEDGYFVCDDCEATADAVDDLWHASDCQIGRAAALLEDA